MYTRDATLHNPTLALQGFAVAAREVAAWLVAADTYSSLRLQPYEQGSRSLSAYGGQLGQTQNKQPERHQTALS